jgi:uncharacterized integral membrane protein
MNRVRLDLCVFLAKAMAALVLIGAIVVLYKFGLIETVSTPSYLSQGQMIMNWPVIFWAVGSTVYSVLFAAMMSAVRYACYFAQDALVGAPKGS